MKFIAEINVMPLKALLDPQGKAVTQTLHNIDFKSVKGVRIGKHIHLSLEADNKKKASDKVKDICEKVLINPIMEGFEFTIKAE
ncbi:MAG: phosphoribosylformylglycinamidine synthase subunit PurS [Bacteroidales bacterium]|nr:phosphoribosylformylglycinamidine synthase subunit PurS [Bacteroidales bacterium]